MYKSKKLLQSVTALRDAIRNGFVLVVYVKKNDPNTIRAAIATTNLDYVPFELRPQKTQQTHPQTPPVREGSGCAQLSNEVRLSPLRGSGERVCYFEFTDAGEPVGWRCFYMKNLIGWCDYVPVDADDERAPLKRMPQRIEE